LRVYGGSDDAVTADGGDYTVHAAAGLDAEGRMYLLDLWLRRAASDEWVEAFCDLVRDWKPIGWAEEQGQIKSGVGPFLDRRMRERRFLLHATLRHTRRQGRARAVDPRPHGAGKALRAGSSPVARRLPRRAIELPAGRHDDQVDAFGLVGQLLDRMFVPSKTRPKDKPQRDRWDAELTAGRDWKIV